MWRRFGFNVVAAVAEDIAAGLISAALKRACRKKSKGAISGEGLQARVCRLHVLPMPLSK